LRKIEARGAVYQADRIPDGDFVRRKPFLKWAGGKYRILDKILRELPAGSRFVEPFAGSCSVYLNVTAESALMRHQCGSDFPVQAYSAGRRRFYHILPKSFYDRQ
jgi:hypothetical protein